jgi:hypothetical protein
VVPYPNPFDATVAADPFTAYEQLRRDHGNVFPISFGSVGPKKHSAIAVLGFAECRDVLASPDHFRVLHARRPPAPSDDGVTKT